MVDMNDRDFPNGADQPRSAELASECVCGKGLFVRKRNPVGIPSGFLVCSSCDVAVAEKNSPAKKFGDNYLLYNRPGIGLSETGEPWQ